MVNLFLFFVVVGVGQQWLKTGFGLDVVLSFVDFRGSL